MTKYLVLYFILAFISLFILDMPTIILATLVYLLGLVLVFTLNITDSKNLRYITNIYQIVFIASFIYICTCYLYMIAHNYNYLLAFDSYIYFLPVTENLLAHGTITSAMSENWSGYNFFSRYHYGYFGYLIPFAFLSEYLDANLYISLQFSTLLIASLSSVIIFKLFLVNNFNSKRAYKYTIIICLFSIVFFYSTQILRDIHVMFFYLLGIYLTFKKELSLINLIKIFIVIFVSCTLRLETGLFLFSLIPVYLLLTMQESKKRNIAVITSTLIAVLGVFLSSIYLNQIINTFMANNEIYLESDKGDGIIGNLQKIPFLGPPLSVIYNAAQPLPFWSKYQPSLADNRPELYNIMTFPLSFASLFNWIALIFILAFLINKKIRLKILQRVPKPLLYQLYLGAFYLLIQSAVIDKRRIMAYYVIFYILFYIIYTNIKVRDRQKLLLASGFTYFSLQVFSILYKI